MKQKKVKKELVLVTYWDYLKHFGREEGRKKWREYKGEDTRQKEELKALKNLTGIVKIKDPQIAEEFVKSGALGDIAEDLEPLQKAILGGIELQDIRKTKADIFECGASMIELIGMPAWNKWIKPQIQKDAVDFVRKTLMLSGEESHKATGGYNYARKILKTIDKWVADYTYLMREEEKKQNASRI